MATVHVALATLPFPSIVAGRPAGSETVESSDTASAPSTLAAGSDSLVWSVTADGGSVWVQFGADPEAVPGDWLVPDGQSRLFAAVAGDRFSVVDVAA